jgi:Protein of unknown function (DUF998)
MDTGTPWIKIGLAAGFLACTGDFIVASILGLLYPGYNFLKDSMSMLGTSDSPFSSAMAMWGVIFTLLFFLFGKGLRAFKIKHYALNTSSWLITIYGLGEGLGSGLFPFDHVGSHLTADAVIHRISGVVGVLCLFAIPLSMLRFLRDRLNVSFYRYSVVMSLIGFLLLVIFWISGNDPLKGTILGYKGLWQRLFLLNYYAYLFLLSFLLYGQDA